MYVCISFFDDLHCMKHVCFRLLRLQYSMTVMILLTLGSYIKFRIVQLSTDV